jgi:excisionase family DNA binding protein
MYGGHIDIEELLDINDVARITKVKVSTVRRHVLLRQIPFHKVGKAVRFRASEIKAWIDDDSRMGADGQPVEGASLFTAAELEPDKTGGEGQAVNAEEVKA